MIDKLQIKNMKVLKNYTIPMTTLHSNNFERLCGVILVFIGMWLDEEIKTKESLGDNNA